MCVVRCVVHVMECGAQETHDAVLEYGKDGSVVSFSVAPAAAPRTLQCTLYASLV